MNEKASPRKILHMDLDAFFCAVEELRDPSLKGKAFAVGGSPDGRGVVSSCSYPARRMGIHSAMPMARAIRLCPNLIVIKVSHSIYSQKSQEVMSILLNVTPIVEQVSVDEAFLDVSDLPDPLEAIARRIQLEIRNKTQLPSSFGGGTNPLIAKIANTVGKKSSRGPNYPNSINCVPAGQERAFLAPMKTSMLWGVGEKTAETLRYMGITTIGQLAVAPPEMIFRKFGKYGLDLLQHANGIDPRPVNPNEEDPKSVSQENTFERDVTDRETLSAMLRRQSDKVGYRLRRMSLVGDTVRIKVRWADFTTIVRQTKVFPPTNRDSVIYETAWRLFLSVWADSGDPVRLIGVGVSGFETGPAQLDFFSPLPSRQKEGDFLKALDEIRTRFGKDSVKRASDLNARDFNIDTEFD